MAEASQWNDFRYPRSLHFVGSLDSEQAGYRAYLLGRRGKEAAADSRIQSLIDRRTAARRAKDFKESDRIRDKLHAMGIELEDCKDGTTTWKVKR